MTEATDFVTLSHSIDPYGSQATPACGNIQGQYERREHVMGADREPTMRAAWLGQELKRMRQAHKVTAKDIADYLGKAQSSISRLESGLYPARLNEVDSYLDICGVRDPQRRSSLSTMCEDIGQRGWWDGYDGDVASSLMDRAWIDERTVNLRVCDMTYMPGLLQTPRYAEAMFKVANPKLDSREIKRWLSFRTTRQHIVTRHDAINLHCLLDEFVLQRTAGTVDTMREQLDYLVQASKHDNVELRILPGHSCNGLNGPFEVLELMDPYPNVAFVTTPAGDICVEGTRVESLARTYDRLANDSLSGEASRKLIKAARDKL